MVNWGKVLANGGVAFFTTLVGLLTTNILVQEILPPTGVLIGALISGGLMAGLAICQTWQREEEESENTTSRKKVNINYLTLF